MKRSWLYYISPCILAAIFCLYVIITLGLPVLAESYEGSRWGILFLIIFVPAFFILLAADYLIKHLTNGRVLYIWIIEVVMIVVTLLCAAYALNIPIG